LDQALMLYPENEAQRDLVHALNRASLAIRMAMALDMRRYRFDLGLAGLIADVGMWYVPKNILDKQERLDSSERAVIEGHVQDTLRLLSSEGGWSAMTRIAVTQHHERTDGSGYPKGLKGAEIHRNGQILAVCDVYTAITLERPGRRLYTPAEALEFIVGGGETLFDFDLVSTFHRLVPPYPVGAEVELSSGEQAVVKEIRGPIKSRPIVRVFADAEGRRLHECYEIDLSDRQHHHLTIVGAVG
jgi:HD-GYP domain-containing protein (c-di-GMP phosphodiesterase class II)